MPELYPEPVQHDAGTRGHLAIRLAQPQRDAAAVAEIYRPYVSHSHASFETEPPAAEEMARRIAGTLARYPWLVAEQAGTVIGYAYASPHHERAGYRWSVNVSAYVAEGHHGRGIGGALYRALLERLAEQGFVNAYAGVCLPNPASVALHERMGFRLVGTYEGVGHKFGRWWDVSWYHRPLAPRTVEPPPPSPPRQAV